MRAFRVQRDKITGKTKMVPMDEGDIETLMGGEGKGKEGVSGGGKVPKGLGGPKFGLPERKQTVAALEKAASEGEIPREVAEEVAEMVEELVGNREEDKSSQPGGSVEDESAQGQGGSETGSAGSDGLPSPPTVMAADDEEATTTTPATPAAAAGSSMEKMIEENERELEESKKALEKQLVLEKAPQMALLKSNGPPPGTIFIGLDKQSTPPMVVSPGQPPGASPVVGPLYKLNPV
jgi:hypothetical protein